MILLTLGCSLCLADDLGIEGYAQVVSNYIDFATDLAGTTYIPAPSLGTFQVTTVGSGSAYANGGINAGATAASRA